MEKFVIKSGSSNLKIKEATNVPPLALVPPKGWTTWVTYGIDVNETKVKALADYISQNGFKDLGFDYVMIDAGWENILWNDATIVENPDGSYSSSTGVLLRNTEGVIVPDATKFPNGMAAVTSYIHSLGLKAGIYSSPGELDCVRSMGSKGFEEIDANTFATWGFDMLKYDNCSLHSGMYEAYSKMARYLQASGRDFLFYLCCFNLENVTKWGAKVGHYWRISLDAGGYWVNPSGTQPVDDIMTLYEKAISAIQFNQPNGWNDCDAIRVTSTHINDNELQSNLAIWCMLNLPITFQGNPNDLSNDRKAILKNEHLYGIHNDVYKMAERVTHISGLDVLVKPLENGVAIMFLNTGSESFTYNGNLIEYLSSWIGKGYSVYDAMNDGYNMGELGGAITFSLESHQSKVLIVK